MDDAKVGPAGHLACGREPPECARRASMRAVTTLIVAAILSTGASASGAETWLTMADRLIRQPVYGCADVLHEPVSGLDEEGYGNAAWSLAYAMAALNVLYEATGDKACMEGAVRVATSLMAARDDGLAARSGAERFTDVVRGRVMKAWGTGRYSDGKHTCWLVHQGMFLFPIADLVKLIRTGGRTTAALRHVSDELDRQVREVVREFDAEWREGPGKGMGYYVDPRGKVLPNNFQSAMGRVFLALGDRASRNRAGKLLRYIRSKLTVDKDRDCWLWAYSQPGPDGPAGKGEDISHAAITAHFLYLSWERKGGFSKRDVERLTRTFTRAIHVGDGRMAGRLGIYEPGDTQFTAQCGRWAHLARFDIAVEHAIRAYVAGHPTTGAIGGPTGALSFAYLARVERRREQDRTGGGIREGRQPAPPPYPSRPVFHRRHSAAPAPAGTRAAEGARDRLRDLTRTGATCCNMDS